MHDAKSERVKRKKTRYKCMKTETTAQGLGGRTVDLKDAME